MKTKVGNEYMKHSKAHVQISVVDMYSPSILNNHHLRILMDIYILKKCLNERLRKETEKTWQLCIHRTNYHCLMPSSRSPMYCLVTLIELQNITEKLLVLNVWSFSFNNGKTKMYNHSHNNQILQNIRQALQENKGKQRDCYGPLSLTPDYHTLKVCLKHLPIYLFIISIYLQFIQEVNTENRSFNEGVIRAMLSITFTFFKRMNPFYAK